MTPRRAIRTPAAVTILIVAVAAALAACGPRGLATANPSPTPVPSSPIVGLVTKVDSQGLSQVQGFVLRDATGNMYEFTLGQLENAAQFPPGHLAEHQITADPVRVYFRQSGPQLVVYRIEDAGEGSSAGAT